MWSDEARAAAAEARQKGSGTHSTGTLKVPTSKLAVRLHAAYFGRTAAGQINTRIGNVWAKASAPKRRAVAERIAQNMRVDNKNSLVRVR